MNAIADFLLDDAIGTNGILRSGLTRIISTSAITKTSNSSLKGVRNKTEIIAHAKIMSIMASSLDVDAGVQDISARFAEHFLVDAETPFAWRFTAPSIRNAAPIENVERTKERLIRQFRAHEFQPVFYQMDDHSKVIEFLTHPSRLVCVFDDEGLQFLWRDGTQSRSEFIRNSFLDFNQMSQKAAMILLVVEPSTIAKTKENNDYALAS